MLSTKINTNITNRVVQLQLQLQLSIHMDGYSWYTYAKCLASAYGNQVVCSSLRIRFNGFFTCGLMPSIFSEGGTLRPSGRRT